MSEIGDLGNLFQGVARAPLVSGHPLESGPVLDSGAKLWVKRDDLTGLGAEVTKFGTRVFVWRCPSGERTLSCHCWCWSIESLPHDCRCWGVAGT